MKIKIQKGSKVKFKEGGIIKKIPNKVEVAELIENLISEVNLLKQRVDKIEKKK